MSKVIDYNYDWFQEVAPRDFYVENDLEREVMHNLPLIFQGYTAFPFKQKLLNNITGKKSAADLGMVKNDYTEWFVIEVELGKHSLQEVIEQIHTFKNCNYDNTHAKYVSDKSGLNLTQLKRLMTSSAPELMVIVNENKKDWKDDLAKLGCKLCYLHIYNDFKGRKIYRLNGDHPIIYTRFCNCKYEKQIPYAIKILDNDFLNGFNILNGDSLNIEYNGIVNVWKRKDAGNQIFLICNSSTPPLDSLTYRYRLNYNPTIPPSKRMFSNILNLFRRLNRNSINTFSFTKD